MLISTDRVVLQAPDLSVGCRMDPVCVHRDSDCGSSTLAEVLDLFSYYCRSKPALVQEGLGCSSEAFLSLQMTSP